MIRALIIVVNLVIVMMVRLFVASPSAEVKAPASVIAGESFVVEVSIATNGETDFVRYSMEFPQGWLVEKIETAGSTFKYEKQTVKFLWSRVGVVKELNISYRVTPPATASGEFVMNCKLSHTVDNLPANIQLTPMAITVTPATPAVAKVVADSTAKPPVVISVDRFVPEKEAGEEFVVSLVINKDDLTSFGKVEDTLPSGFTAKVIKADGADFKFENGVVKFSWFVMPAKHVLNVQYRVTVAPGVYGNQSIGGHFSYVENETGKLILVAPSIVKLKAAPVVTKEEPVVIKEEPLVIKEEPIVIKEEPVVKKEEPVVIKEEPVVKKEEPVVLKEEPVVKKEVPVVIKGEPIANTAAHGINFSVQIAAFTRRIPVSYFTETFHLSATVNAEMHNGLNKYTTGSFPTYQAAHDNRNQVRTNGIIDAFVIAYNNGKRITVQEALMITSQKWIQ
ncbi:MAG: hypothetical protein ABIQ40_13145 [Bacteroidia bacterium]